MPLAVDDPRLEASVSIALYVIAFWIGDNELAGVILYSVPSCSALSLVDRGLTDDSQSVKNLSYRQNRRKSVLTTQLAAAAVQCFRKRVDVVGPQIIHEQFECFRRQLRSHGLRGCRYEPGDLRTSL